MPGSPNAKTRFALLPGHDMRVGVALSVILDTLPHIATHESIMMRTLAMLSALTFAATAHAQSGPTGFQSPSKNIACQYFDYGGAFEINAKGPATRLCHGDTVMDKSLPVLGYGEVWQRGGFTCKSEQAGITCFNADRRGFSLARVRQEVF
jgi:hypothetical protein